MDPSVYERFLQASQIILHSQDARARVASAMGMSLEEYEARLEEALWGPGEAGQPVEDWRLQFIARPPGKFHLNPGALGVIYDQEHIDGQGGFHASEEDGGMWIECITEGGTGSKTRISERVLRAHGIDVPPFTGTPCPRCFPSEASK